MPSGQLDARVKEFVAARDLAGAPYRRDFANGHITYADLADGGRLGYLRISGFGGYLADEKASYAAQLAELERALNTVLTPERSRHLHGLIIDLRINGGGSDALGIHIAERLTGSGRTFDGTGIPPEVSVPVFTEEEFGEGRDSGFDRAVHAMARR